MSQAFVKEEESEWLNDVRPDLGALLLYLRRENNGRVIFQQEIAKTKEGKEIYVMSNGLSYMLNDERKWEVFF